MAHDIDITIEPACAALGDADELRELVAYALAEEGVAGPVALSVVLVDDATIHDLNRRFLGHDEPTDVITFALDGGGGGAGAGGFVVPEGARGGAGLGEIYVSCERAAAQSGEWGGSPEREARFLVLHGVLHLLGWDDATAEGRRRMLDRQEAILTGFLSGRAARR